MARKPDNQLKQGLLLVFVAVSVILVGLTWADNLSDPQETTSTQMRGAPPTAESVRTLTVVVPTKEHKNEHSPTVEPGATVVATPTIETTPVAPRPKTDSYDVTDDN